MDLDKIKQLGKYSIFRKHSLKFKLSGIFTPKCTSYSVYRNIRYMFMIPTAYCDDCSTKPENLSDQEVPEKSLSHSSIVSLTNPVTDEEVNVFIQNETAMDRLQRMFSRDPVTKKFGKDLESVGQKAWISALSAGAISFLFKKNVAQNEVAPGIKQLELYSKKGRFGTQRQMYDRIILDRMNMMFKWGSLAGLFIGSFFLTAQVIATYRNKTSPFEYAAGGVVTGSLLRIHIGPRAILTGGITIGLGGFAIGLIMYSLRYATGTTQDVNHFNNIKTLMELKTIPRPVLTGNEKL